MEMRRRGYDVIARSSSKGRTASQMLAMTKNGKLEHVKFEQGSKENRKQFVNRSYNELLNKLESKGEGARGYLGIKYESMWSGHALFWEVSNGKAIIYDPQAGAYGVKVDSTMSIADYNYGFEIIRFDNVKLKPEITEACRSNPKRRS